MNKRYQYQYGEGWSDEPDYDISCVWEPSELDDVAKDIGEDYFHNHDGWESMWPITFVIFHDGKKLGERTVDMEAVPHFFVPDR